MDSASSPCTGDTNGADDIRFARITRTSNFRGGTFATWLRASIAVIGAGLLGARLTEEAVLSGTQVTVFEPGIGEAANLGNQRCHIGLPKVQTLVDRCDAVRPGRVRAFPCDVRHAGVRPLRECDVWFDCTDDPSLAWCLTELSNGFAKPLLRCAVDGSGQLELGRVLCSSGGTGHACQVCSYSLSDFLRRPRRTPCPRMSDDGRPPTIAGGAIGAGTAGLALSLGQRLIAGTGRDAVLNHECVLDWTHFQLIHLTLQRSPQCLSGHQVWECLDSDITVEEGTLCDVFSVAEQYVAARPLALAPFLLPLNVHAYCECGAVIEGVGTDCAGAPPCPRCGCGATRWLRETRIEAVHIAEARRLGILDVPLAALGIPAGALFVACCAGRPQVRILLA